MPSTSLGWKQELLIKFRSDCSLKMCINGFRKDVVSLLTRFYSGVNQALLTKAA